MKIMIIGAQPSGNKGAEAMLEIVAKTLKANIKESVFFFETLSGAEDFSSFKKQGFNFILTKFVVKNIFSPYGSNLKDIDVVVDIGGLVYTDKSVKNNVRSFIKHFSLIIRRKKLIFFTQDFGPAKKLHTRILGGIIAKKAFMLFPRSRYSYNVLINDFKVKKENVSSPFPDSTLLFKDDSVPNIVEEGVPYVVISPSIILYNSFGHKYIDLLGSIIELALKKYKVYILVHSFTLCSTTSDQFVASKLCEQYEDTNLINKNINPIILKKFLSGAEYIISSRYHVIVGAMSTNVPALAIGWNEKYLSFLNLYDMPENNIEFNEQSLENISKWMIDFESSKGKIKQHLKKINYTLKQKVAESFKLLVKSIKA